MVYFDDREILFTNLLFNKTYYEGLGSNGFSVDSSNRELEGTRFDHSCDYTEPPAVVTHRFCMRAASTGNVPALSALPRRRKN